MAVVHPTLFPRLAAHELSRRCLLRTASAAGLFALAGPAAFGASDFWNKKEPAAWSPDEIETLKTKSPWAKKVRGEMSGLYGGRGGMGGDSTERGGSRGGMGGMAGGDSGGMGGGGGMGGMGGGGGRGGGRGGGGESGMGATAPQGPEVVVRWLNARPILEATKTELPPELADHYAVSVSGLPSQMLMMALGGGRGRGRGGRERAEAAPESDPQTSEDPAARQKAMIDRLLRSATLTAKGKDPQTSDLLRQTADKQSLIFGFPKQSLPLAASDKDVQFLMKLGVLTIKAKFEPKEMMYKGELSI